MRNLGILSPKKDVFIKSLLLGMRELNGRGGRKTVKGRGDRGHQGNKDHSVDRISAYMNSQRLR